MSVPSWIKQFYPVADSSKVVSTVETTTQSNGEKGNLDLAVESLLPAGKLERIASMTDAEIDTYAWQYGVTGQALIEAIFDPVRNAEYAKAKGMTGNV